MAHEAHEATRRKYLYIIGESTLHWAITFFY